MRTGPHDYMLYGLGGSGAFFLTERAIEKLIQYGCRGRPCLRARGLPHHTYCKCERNYGSLR